jgi:hypothetical protein
MVQVAADPTGVRQLFEQELPGSRLEQEVADFLTFSLPSRTEDRHLLARFFERLDSERARLGVIDVQLSLPTLGARSLPSS